jgi:hypothetical protein
VDSIIGLVTSRNEKDCLRATLRRASCRLISIDPSRHHEHCRVIVNIVGQFGWAYPMSYIVHGHEKVPVCGRI